MKAEVTIKYEDGIVVKFDAESVYLDSQEQEGGEVMAIKMHANMISKFSVGNKEVVEVPAGARECKNCKYCGTDCFSIVGPCSQNHNKWKPEDKKS